MHRSKKTTNSSRGKNKVHLRSNTTQATRQSSTLVSGLVPSASPRNRSYSTHTNTTSTQRVSSPSRTVSRSSSTVASRNMINASSYFSDLSLRREVSPTRALMPLLRIPGMVSLGSGLPNNECFPFETMSFKLKTGEVLELSKAETDEALQYSATPGLPKLVSQLKKHIIDEHNPIYDHSLLDVSVTTGSQDALTKAFEMLLNPGDGIIVEKPTYSGALSYLRPYPVKFHSVPVDEQGVIPSELNAVLMKAKASGEPMPRVLYTIASGQNPTGCTAGIQRKKEIYAVAQQFGLVILEDDPYYNLYYGKERAPQSFDAYNPPKADSYLSIDADGRVIRFDSFSKVLSSGLRLGFVSGPKDFIQQLNLTTQATTLHSCGVAQQMVSKLLEAWGKDGWDNHVKKTKFFYAQRRDYFIDKVNEILGDRVEYIYPDCGMFLFFAISKKYVGDDTNAKDLIQNKAVNAKVLMLPGEAFLAEPPDRMFVRASFSVASDEEIIVALERFAKLIDEQREEKGL